MAGPQDVRGPAARGVVREIDQELKRLNKREEALAAERERLLTARAALTGKASVGPARGRRISQDDIATFLDEHPGSWPAQIAQALEVPVTNVSAHLYRGKGERFERLKDGWHLDSDEGSHAR
jgi:hypothetical protein